MITGGTGQVGSALARALLRMGEPVTIVSRNPQAAAAWTSQGASFAVCDIRDTKALHKVFMNAKKVFVLNPPADPTTDTSAEERRTADSLVTALQHTNLERIVVASTLGAQEGDMIGDLGVLYGLEQGVATLGYPYSVMRSGYYMSNWAQSLKTVKETGQLMSFLPADLKIPMVAPGDIGQVAARLMTDINPPKYNSIQGPELYSPKDVATALSEVLERPVSLTVIPRDELIATFKSFGFSEEAAISYARMTELTIDDPDIPSDSIKGRTSLKEYVSSLVHDQ